MLRSAGTPDARYAFPCYALASAACASVPDGYVKRPWDLDSDIPFYDRLSWLDPGAVVCVMREGWTALTQTRLPQPTVATLHRRPTRSMRFAIRGVSSRVEPSRSGKSVFSAVAWVFSRMLGVRVWLVQGYWRGCKGGRMRAGFGGLVCNLGIVVLRRCERLK